MTHDDREGANLGAVVVPFVADARRRSSCFWNRLVSPADLVIAAVMYLLTAVGITVGFHRLLTHRSFQTSKPLEYAFAVLGSMAVQGPVIAWVADHRKHHAHTDEEGDPHSPHVGHDGGLRGMLAGLWHAHTGWLMSTQGRADWKRFAPDLYEDAGMRVDQPPLRPPGLAQPGAAGARRLPGQRHPRRRRDRPALGRTGADLLRPPRHLERQLRVPLPRQRRFDTDDRSTNVFWLALPSLGESWHHNHHAFPRSAVHGLKRWELDPSAAIIAAMEKLGLARNVIRISRGASGSDESSERVELHVTRPTVSDCTSG